MTITGPIEKFANITPRFVRFKGSGDELLQNKVIITPTKKHDFSIIEFQVQNGKNIKVDFKNIPPGKKGWEIIVTNKRKDTGRYFDIITLKTDNPLKNELKIRIYGDISNKKEKAIK